MKFSKRTAILAKIEATYGTDATPAGATDFMLVRNASIDPASFNMVDRQLIRSTMGGSQQLVAGQKVTVNFEVEIAGAGTSAVTLAKYDCLLQACGMSSTVNTTVSVDYAPINTGFKSVTIYVYIDGAVHKVVGAVGDVEWDFPKENIPVMKFAFTGLYAPPVDESNPALTMTGWQTPVPVNGQNTTGFAIHGYAGTMVSLNFKLGNKIAYENLVGGTPTEFIQITDRDVTGKLVMLAPDTVAVKDFWSDAHNVTLGALTLTHGPATPGSQFAINCPATAVQIMNPKYGDLDGMRTIEMDLRFVPTVAGGDELLVSTK